MKQIVPQTLQALHAGSMSSNVEAGTNVFQNLSIVTWKEIVSTVVTKLDAVCIYLFLFNVTNNNIHIFTANVHILTPPPPMITLDIGDLFEISCKAVGVPTPEVVWRLNWGHIPEKCRTRSEGGVGTLTCQNIQVIFQIKKIRFIFYKLLLFLQEHDQGAYSCEAINIRGSQFAVPDTILMVNRPGKICPTGYFNDEARSPTECISCFCFGATTECQSADLFTYQVLRFFNDYKQKYFQQQKKNLGTFNLEYIYFCFFIVAIIHGSL